MEIKVKHNLSKDEAHKRIDGLLSQLQKENEGMMNNPTTEWNSDKTEMKFSVEVMGNKISGQVFNADKEVTLKGTVPPSMMMFSGMIQNTIKQKLTELLK